MLSIARVLGVLLESYVRVSTGGNRDCRLLVPGLTRNISKQIHEYLFRKGINSYLVIGEDEEPSESTNLIRPIGLTSRRIGSFVAIASPGQLIHIQDSIRGSGGTIRSMSFSEEWPWIDNGSEPFRFDGPVLDCLVHEWTVDPPEQKWLREFVLDGLLGCTRASSWRGQLFLEDILGTFNSSLYPEIGDVREKLLFHTGVPRPTAPIPAVAKLIQSSSRLCQKITERCQKDENVRDQARDMVIEIVPKGEQANVKLAVDSLLDGIGRSSTVDLGLLGFHACWGLDKNDSTHWRRLDAEQLAALFNVKEYEKAEVTYDVSCERAIIAHDSKKLASFVGEHVNLDISYRIPEGRFAGHAWEVQVLNRQKVVARQTVSEPQGTFPLSFSTTDSTARYSRKVPLKIVLLYNGSVDAEERLDMHLCGQDRPAFAVVEPGFQVVDATPTDTDEIPDKKINTEVPVHVFLFSDSGRDVSMHDEDGGAVALIETGQHGIWRSAQPVDVSAEQSDRLVRVCRFESLSAVICFESTNLDKGEFTLEDELRTAIPKSKDERIKELANLFEGRSNKPFRGLGHIDEPARRRIAIADLITSPIGWRPLLTNLLEPVKRASGAGSRGDFANYLGSVEGDGFSTLKLPEDALQLLRAYSDSRDVILKEIVSRLDMEGLGLDHPVYATHPIFSHAGSKQTEQLLSRYLEAYCGILEYLESNQSHLEWLQLFVLTHLDCVVHWDNSRIRSALFLVGPWHPLVLAKRFMVQAALFSRTKRLLNGQNGKAFKHLSSLLGRVQGFRWLVGVSVNDRLLEPVYVSSTSDPGWHVAFNANGLSLATEEGLGGFGGICRRLRYNFGLEAEIVTGGSESLAITCLSSYLRAFPSRRSIGMRVRRGYVGSSIVQAADRYLHAEEGPTDDGRKLPGGVRMYFEESINGTEDTRWSDPPLYVYTYPDDAECIQAEHPDIYMLPPVNDMSFRNAREAYTIPRGTGRNAVFSQPLNWLTEGQSLVPNSITYEFDSSPKSSEGIGGAFTRATGKVAAVLGDRLVTVCSMILPQTLDAPWVVVPGEGVDPAILVKYVRDGADRAIQERALWDFKLDMANKETSFFILSIIPKGFQVAVNGFFGRDDIASSFIVELGRIGIAIGGEALKSGRHALGVVGLVGAVRLFLGIGSTESSPLARTPATVGFLVPVDSFSSFFGRSGSDQTDGKRTDLLAIEIVFLSGDHERIAISCCGIESKFTSGTFGVTRAHAALDQARSTAIEFKQLVETSLREDAIPERLALLELLKFGLRITSPSQPSEIPAWVKMEASIYNAVLSGNFEYCTAMHNAVLVTTEEQLPGVAEQEVLQEGLWVRLTKKHWPGVWETPQLGSIRKELSKQFSACAERAILVEDKKEISAEIFTVQQSVIEESTPKVVRSDRELVANNEPETKVERQPQGTDPRDEIVPASLHGPLDRIFIGVDDRRSAVYFNPQSSVDPLDNINVMVTGSSGTGKTQLLKYLICKLREQEKPVLLLDFKNDFASDSKFADRAALTRVFVTFDGLPYNPLIPYPLTHPGTGELLVQCGQHIAGVASVLGRTYGLGAQQQVAVKNAMAAAFSSAGISPEGSVSYSDKMRFPDFSQVGDSLEHDNPAAYNRLDPLFTLALFRSEFRDCSFESLVGKSTVLDLSQIPSDQIKNTLAQLVVMSAHAYYNSQSHSGSIRQVLVFDEAHRVLTSDYMVRLVRECRAYGVATLLSSQYPSDFPSEISSSMATKIVHGNGRESDKVKGIVQLLGCEGREGDISNLDRFQAFVSNRHYPQALVRTMNYPLYLVWTRLRQLGTATREELSRADGIDTSKLPIAYIVHQLESLGLAEEREGRVFLLERT